MQTFNIFDNAQNKKLIETPTWEEYSSLLEQVNSLTTTIASLQETITSMNSSIDALQTSISKVNTSLPIKIIQTNLGQIVNISGRVMSFSTVMNNLIGESTGDVLAVISRGNSNYIRLQTYEETSSNYTSAFAILAGSGYNSHSTWWFNGSTGNSQFDVNWADRLIDNTDARTYAFFSRH